MKSHTRLLVSLVIISMVANTTACSKKIEAIDGKAFNTEVVQIETFSIPSFAEEIDESAIDISDVAITTEYDISKVDTIAPSIEEEPVVEKSLEDILKETLYDENIDYQLVIKTYLNTDYDKRESLKNDYLRALYMLMINSNVPMNAYIYELNTLMIMQQFPTCVPEDIWNLSFGNLIALDPNCQSIYEMYIDMAMYIHNICCDKEHYLNDYYGYSCEDLEKEYIRKLEITEL